MKEEDIAKLPHKVRKELFECREHLRLNPPTRWEFISGWFRVNIYLPIYVCLFRTFVRTIQFFRDRW